VSGAEPQRAAVAYPGGLAARYRWSGSANAAAVFALSEEGGSLTDHGPLVSDEPDRLCRAELRVEGPGGAWTARFASPIFDAPSGLAWDTAGLLVVRYGFRVYALAARTGELRWSHALGTPVVAVLGSSRLPHVIVQGEIETVALREDGSVAWHASHDEVVTEAELVGGRLVLAGYDGRARAMDPLSGRVHD
jgi:outer membrane protein assembly factor BamB